MPSTKAAGGGIFSGVFTQGCQGTTQGQEDFELSWYLFYQQGYIKVLAAKDFVARKAGTIALSKAQGSCHKTSDNQPYS